jgi:hypothetical protein
MVTPGEAVGRQAQGQQLHRPRQPLPERCSRRSQHQRRPHPVLPRREIPAADPADAQEESLVATGNSVLTIVHALLSDPSARYTDLGADYYEQRMHTHRQARNHVKSLERLGYKVTIQAINPGAGELLAPAS